jgi:hypothetical protein
MQRAVSGMISINQFKQDQALLQNIFDILEERGVTDAKMLFDSKPFQSWIAYVCAQLDIPIHFEMDALTTLRYLHSALCDLDPSVTSEAESSHISASTWQRRELSASFVERLQKMQMTLRKTKEDMENIKNLPRRITHENE